MPSLTKPTPSPDDCAVFDISCVAFNLRKSARVVGRIYEHEMRDAPINGPLFSLLAVIHKRRTTTITGLAQDIGLDRTTLTRDLKPLEKRGLISIAQKEKRSKEVSLLPKGEAALKESLICWRRAQDKVVAALGEDRWSRMRQDLSAVMALSDQ